MSFYPLIINSTTCKVTIRVTSNEQAIISSNQRESRQILAIPPIQFWCNVKYMNEKYEKNLKIIIFTLYQTLNSGIQHNLLGKELRTKLSGQKKY